MSNFSKDLRKLGIVSVGIVSLALASCGDSNTTEQDVTKVNPNVLDTNDAMGMTINGKLFSIPSPFQTAELIKSTGAPYNASMLNPTSATASYSTKFAKALNLGVYGADLGYATMYDNTNEALTYLSSVEQLSKELDMGGAFSEDIMDRFSENMGNKDSMLVIVSDAYRNGDEYLKNNDRSQEAGLILTGGWVEALYFACEVVQQNNNQNLINRIGEQKTTLSNLIELLEQYNTEESYSNLLSEMEELYSYFANVEFTYSYQKPETDADNQITVIKSTTKVNLTPEILTSITEKVKALRTKIVESAL
ncbi:MAG: hypothetical protein K1X56_03595 [Flavobacteriales bacterium]|nr:hypothetical protein [Flavobacteriales bacterium]